MEIKKSNRALLRKAFIFVCIASILSSLYFYFLDEGDWFFGRFFSLFIGTMFIFVFLISLALFLYFKDFQLEPSAQKLKKQNILGFIISISAVTAYLFGFNFFILIVFGFLICLIPFFLHHD